jgi:hypothetical protein
MSIIPILSTIKPDLIPLDATDRIKKELRLKIGATIPKYKHKSANTPTGLLTKEAENEIPIYYKRVFDVSLTKSDSFSKRCLKSRISR